MTPRVLVIGGLDPSGGAGISADARTLLAHGCEALPVLSAVAVQNRFGMQRVQPVEFDLLRAQLRAALDDGGVVAIKTGLLGSAARVREVGLLLADLAPSVPLVVDPVLSATAGGYEAGSEVALAYREVLAPRAAVFTPNGPELAAVLEGATTSSLFAAGCCAVLRKGGHDEGATLVDRLMLPASERSFLHERLPVGPVHGTGCALASAVAAGLANGLGVVLACEQAIAWLQRCLRALPPCAPDKGAEVPRPRPLPIVLATLAGGQGHGTSEQGL